MRPAFISALVMLVCVAAPGLFARPADKPDLKVTGIHPYTDELIKHDSRVFEVCAQLTNKSSRPILVAKTTTAFPKVLHSLSLERFVEHRWQPVNRSDASPTEFITLNPHDSIEGCTLTGLGANEFDDYRLKLVYGTKPSSRRFGTIFSSTFKVRPTAEAR